MNKDIKLNINIAQPDIFKDTEVVTIKGKDGRDGVDGVMGDKGDTGEKGDKGDQGEKGDSIKGDSGKDGVDGKDGKDGVDGKTPSIDSVIKEVKKFIPKDKKITYKEIVDAPDIEVVKDEVARFVQNSVASRDYHLTELKDVTITSPTNAQVLKYNSTTGKWENNTDSNSIAWGAITGTVTNQTDLINYIDGVINTDSGWTKTGTNVYLTTSTDSVGIGTASPTRLLDIYGSHPVIRYNRSGSYVWEAGVGDGSASNIPISFWGVRDVSSDAVRFAIAYTTGYVGIGTTAPSARLHSLATTEQLRLGYDTSNYTSFTVNSVGDLTISPTGLDVIIPNRLLVGTSPVVTGKVSIQAADGTNPLSLSGTTKGIRFEMNSVSSVIRGVDSTLAGSYQPLTLGASALIFETNGTTEAMRILSTGNVGIGTAVPAHKLGIVATADTRGLSMYQGSGAGNYGAIGFQHSPTNALAASEIRGYNPSAGSDGDLAIAAMNTGGTLVEYLRVKGATGNVGIGTTAPLSRLDVYHDSAAYNPAAYNSTGVVLSASSTDSDFSGIRFTNIGQNREHFFGVVQTSSQVGAFVFQNFDVSAGTYGERMRITSTGLVGIGITPSGNGLLQTKSGSATTMFSKVGGTIADFYTDVSVGGAETDIYTTTLAASILGANGDKIIGTYGGNFVTVGTELTQLKAYFAGTAIWDSTAITMSSGTTSWRIRVEVIRVSATVVRYTVSLNTSGASGYNYCSSGELTALTLSNTNIIKVTGTSSGVGSGVGDIVGKHGSAQWQSAA